MYCVTFTKRFMSLILFSSDIKVNVLDLLLLISFLKERPMYIKKLKQYFLKICAHDVKKLLTTQMSRLRLYFMKYINLEEKILNNLLCYLRIFCILVVEYFKEQL